MKTSKERDEKTNMKNRSKPEPRLRITDFTWRERIEAENAADAYPNKPSVAPLGLTASMQIGSASFHVDAYLVEYRAQCSKEGTKLFAKPSNGERLNETIELRRNDEATCWLWRAHGMEGYCETVKIPGIGKNREYAIFVSPFCE